MTFPKLNSPHWTTYFGTRDLEIVRKPAQHFRNHFIAIQKNFTFDWLVLTTEGWQPIAQLPHQKLLDLQKLMKADQPGYFPDEVHELVDRRLVRTRPDEPAVPATILHLVHSTIQGVQHA